MTTIQSSIKQVKVTISADPGTEVVITDSRRNKITSSAGQLEAHLSPGLYKVRYKAGGDLADGLFEVVDQPVNLVAPSLKINTPIPLSGSATTHEYQQGPAGQLTHSALQKVGQGSEFALFARDSSKDWGDSTSDDPSLGLVLEDLSGSPVLDISEVGIYDKDGCNTQVRAELDPGTYLLTLRKESGDVQLPIVMTPGWRTMVFVDSASWDQKREPDIYGASVVMNRPSEEFQPNDETLKYAELARYSLEMGRARIDAATLANEMLLENTITYPMLGILLGHLLVLAKGQYVALLEKLEQKLEEAIPNHPDVLALRIALAQEKNVQVLPDGFPLSGPPMLRSSWDILVQASVEYPSIFPADADWMQYICNLTGSQGWLAWQRPSKELTLEVRANVADYLSMPAKDKIFASVSGIFEDRDSTKEDFANLMKVARSVLTTAEGKIDRKQLIDTWHNFKEALSDHSIAKNPLQNALRRKLLSLLDEESSHDNNHEFSWEKLARDMRVPNVVLVKAASALYVAVQNNTPPPEDPSNAPPIKMGM